MTKKCSKCKKEVVPESLEDDDYWGKETPALTRVSFMICRGKRLTPTEMGIAQEGGVLSKKISFSEYDSIYYDDGETHGYLHIDNVERTSDGKLSGTVRRNPTFDDVKEKEGIKMISPCVCPFLHAKNIHNMGLTADQRARIKIG